MINLSNYIEIFTDGSKDAKRKLVGSACVCPSLNIIIQRNINCQATIYTAECIGISDGLDIALKEHNKNNVIFSDSLSALESLQNCRFDIRINPYIF